MTGTRSNSGWAGRFLLWLVLILIGAGAAVWSLGHYPSAARLLGITPPSPRPALAPNVPQPAAPVTPTAPPPAPQTEGVQNAHIATLAQRMSQVEQATQRAEGSAGRADALVVAFAARRAIDRGVALGYLENALKDRFGAQHPAAVATIITNAHQPVRLDDLTQEYEALGPDLRRGGPQDSWWTDFKRGFGSLVEVHRANRPATNADARYDRALRQLSSGEVDQAVAETMRLPGAARAEDWSNKARRYIAVHRALDEIESAALMPGPQVAQ